MLRVLLESNAPRQRRRASTAASIAVHTALIAGAIVATASANSAALRRERVAELPPIYTEPVPRAEQRSARDSRPAPRQRSEHWVEENMPTVPQIPDLSPPFPDKALADIDPRSLLGPDSGFHRETWRPDQPAGRPPLGPIGDEPATLATVERAAALLVPPRPRYPDQLRAAGVTGRVVVRLIVDTTGRVEPASVVVRESSHDLFSDAVRAVLASLRFRPAEVGGRKVRMLVDLPFEFRLKD
ncbi:MAG: TonB family protein [Gemmatimonadaceae bacterium]